MQPPDIIIITGIMAANKNLISFDTVKLRLYS
jgi:hypothetical protein